MKLFNPLLVARRSMFTLFLVGAVGCVTSPVKERVTLKTLPPDRCAAPYGKQARETMTNSGTTCVIYRNNAEMKKAERKYTASVAALAKQSLTEAQKKMKADKLMASWFSEAGKAAGKTSCPTGMRKAADFPSSAVTCTASLETGASAPIDVTAPKSTN